MSNSPELGCFSGPRMIFSKEKDPRTPPSSPKSPHLIKSKTVQPSSPVSSPRIKPVPHEGKNDHIKTSSQVFADIHPPFSIRDNTGHRPQLNTRRLTNRSHPVVSNKHSLKNTESLIPHIALTPSVQFTPEFQEVQKATEQLNYFIKHYQAQMEKLHALFQDKKPTDDKQTMVSLVHDILMDTLSEKWLALRQAMDQLLIIGEGKNDKEEDVNFRCINLHNLGLQKPGEACVLDGNKLSINQVKKNLKEEPHLKLAFQFFLDLMIDLAPAQAWENTDNIKKIHNFMNLKKLETNKEALCSLIFSYIEHLFLLGELLKQFGDNLRIIHHNSQIMTRLLPHAKRFLKHLEEIKTIKKLEPDEKKEKIDGCCTQYGECILLYAKSLVQHFHSYFFYMSRKQFYQSCFSETIHTATKKRLLDYCTGFSTDFIRAVKGKFLNFCTDRTDIAIPSMTKQVCKSKDSPELHDFCYAFLQFLIVNLKITSKDLIQFNPLKHFKEFDKQKTDTTIAMGLMYDAFEACWENVKKDFTDTPHFPGIFKLLPLLRIFNQNNILAIHKSIINLHKGVHNKNITGIDCEAIIAQFPTAIKHLAYIEGQLLDQEEKSISIEFLGENVKVIFKRIAALNNISNGVLKMDSSQFIFPNCSVTAFMVLKSSIHDMANWKVQTFINIERPQIENANLEFLQRYSLLITLLESMGMEYHIQTNKS